jgi:LmbE family N-acetylglucosaminyl deacetylase
MRLAELVEQLLEILKQADPEIVLTPAYEGGHPDHDSAALAMHLTKQRLPARFAHWEYRLYHADANGNFDSANFLSNGETEPEILSFSDEERQLKRRMIDKFRSQAEMTGRFSVTNEHVRVAPSYDFQHPPHEGELLYEKFGWGPSWKDWHRQAKSALA